MAKKWYESLPSLLYSWSEWQAKSLDTFSCRENYEQPLNKTLEEYFFEKCVLLNRSGISVRKAVDCIIFGIDDRAIKMVAEAGQYEDANKFIFLKNIKMSKRFDKNVLNISNNIISSQKTTSFERRSNFNYGQSGY